MTSLWLSAPKRFNQSMSFETLVYGWIMNCRWSSTSSNWLMPVFTSSDIYDKSGDMSAVTCQDQPRGDLTGREVTTRLVLALVISRLDYCNSVLAGLPASTVNILQRVQNAADRLICQLKPREHVTPSLQRLHWLPVKQQVQYKLCTIMYAVHHGLAPS